MITEEPHLLPVIHSEGRSLISSLPQSLAKYLAFVKEISNSLWKGKKRGMREDALTTYIPCFPEKKT